MSELRELWSTPVWFGELPGWESQVPVLRALLLSERARAGGRMLDGSSHNVWDWAEPEVSWLRAAMTKAATSYLRARGAEIEGVDRYWGRAWGNILGGATSGGGEGPFAQAVHAHHEADFFAVFYAAADETTADEGAVVLLDPRFSNNTLLLNRDDKHVIVPRTGWLLIAPGNVWHEVTHYRRPEPRISIACNFQYSLQRIRD